MLLQIFCRAQTTEWTKGAKAKFRAKDTDRDIKKKTGKVLKQWQSCYSCKRPVCKADVSVKILHSVIYNAICSHQIVHINPLLTILAAHSLTFSYFLPTSLFTLVMCVSSHPTSIPFPSPSYYSGVYPSCHRSRGRVHPGQVASPSQGQLLWSTQNHQKPSLFWTVGVSYSTWKEPMHPQAEHANS